MDKPIMQTVSEPSPRDTRLIGLIDLELGADSKWMLVFRDAETEAPRLIVAPNRVTFGEVIENLRTVAEGVDEAVKAKFKGQL